MNPRKSRQSGTTLLRQAPDPLYRQIAQRLLEGIEAGEWAAGQRLPSESDLIERFSVSRITVRQALAILQKQGKVIARRGMGTFVADKVVRHDLDALKGFYGALRETGVEPETRLLEFADAAAPVLPVGVDLPVRLKRLYSLEGRPFALVCAQLPRAVLTLGEQRAERLMVYQILEHFLGLRIGRAEITIRCQKPPADVAALLGLKSREQSLVLERLSYSTAEVVCESMRIHIVPERFEFRLRVTGPLEIARAVHPVAAARRAPARAGVATSLKGMHHE